MTDVPRDRAATSPTGVLLNWSKQVGMIILPIARANILAAVWATVWLKNCSGRRRPPKKKHMPMTSRRLDKILPMREVWTITILFWVKAMIETIISTALLVLLEIAQKMEYCPTCPKEAFKRPPKLSPT